MDTLLRFGSGDQLYVFDPENQIDLRDNFRDVVPRTTRMPGLDGGYDEFGDGPAPGEIGLVETHFWLYAASEAEMTRKLRTLGSLKSFGVKRLYLQPMDGAEDELYVEARLNSAPVMQRSEKQPHRRNHMTVTFQVAAPGWLAPGTESALWGDGTLWGGGGEWGGEATPVTCVGLSNDFSVTPGGNAITHPRILVSIPTAKSATDIRIQRIAGSLVVDELRYDATMSAGDSLEINTRALSVLLNGADAYGAEFSFQNARWFQLWGGISNTIRVLMDNPTDETRVTFKYYEVYA